MDLKNVLYNSVTVSLPKNIIQFFLGFVLYWLIFGAFDAAVLMIALAGFLLSYSSIYFLNDIVDFEDDRHDKDKMGWKLVAKGAMSKKTALATGRAFMRSGP